MKLIHNSLFDLITQTPADSGGVPWLSEAAAKNARRFHRSLPAYRETRLVSLACAADQFGVAGILVKDESDRFGLKAFKGLGGSYGMFRILCERLGLDPESADFKPFEDPEIRRRCADIEFVTATDGNHGKGVSWAAQQFGCRAHVYMPVGTVEARRRAIEEAGSATAEITPWSYDETVAYAAKQAGEHGWILIQDTAWDGYEQIPQWIIEGYLTIGEETAEQLGGLTPTHVFLQAGVGSMAGGLTAYFRNRYAPASPLVTIVEPTSAACVYESVKAGDGAMHTVPGDAETIMAGLNCGTPCSVVWPVLRDEAAAYAACTDAVTITGMRAYARPVGSDQAVISGESGAVTFGLLWEILRDGALRREMKIDQESVILLVNTEGDTDPEGYRRVLSEEEQI